MEQKKRFRPTLTAYRALEREVNELRAENERLRCRSFLERVFNK